jgi:hypothetical protein
VVNPVAAIQREYKDRLFNFLFGSEENKAWTLSLYNAVNGTVYRSFSPDDITAVDSGGPGRTRI